MKRCLLALGSAIFAILSIPVVHAQYTAYLRVITERAGKIVAVLGLPDSVSYYHVRTIVANQYRDLNDIYTERDTKLKDLKALQPAPDLWPHLLNYVLPFALRDTTPAEKHVEVYEIAPLDEDDDEDEDYEVDEGAGDQDHDDDEAPEDQSNDEDQQQSGEGA